MNKGILHILLLFISTATSGVLKGQSTIINQPPSASLATICAGNSATISIPGSQTGVGYALANYPVTSTVTIGPAQIGTGNSMGFPTGIITATSTFVIVGVIPGTSTVVMNPPVVITVKPLPHIIVNTAVSCAGSIDTLTASGAASYTWNTGATGTTITPSPTITTSYTIAGTASNNCVNTATTTVYINPLPNVTVNSDSICSGDSTLLLAQGANAYTWMPSTGLNNTSDSMVIASPVTSITYTVVGTNSFNCKNTALSYITVMAANSGFCSDTLIGVKNALNVHNAFSPNNDGLNDLFIIDNIEYYPNNHVYIYNRWGQLLWNKTNYNNTSIAWDGKTQDEAAALYVGTYYYIIESAGTTKLKGWIELTK